MARIFALFAITFCADVFAQGLPATDLWLTKIVDDIPGVPVKISQGDGYNNRPHFSDDGTVIYYTREMPMVTSGPETAAVYTSARRVMTGGN